MLTAKRGEAAARDIQDWAIKIAGQEDQAVDVDVSAETDSSTYVIRLVSGARVLIFRLSESQVRSDGREAECARTLRRKIEDLRNLL